MKFAKFKFKDSHERYVCNCLLKNNVKSKVHHRTGHKSRDGGGELELHSLTWALHGVGGRDHAPTNLTRERDLLPIIQQAGWVPVPV